MSYASHYEAHGWLMAGWLVRHQTDTWPRRLIYGPITLKRVQTVDKLCRGNTLYKLCRENKLYKVN